MVTPCSALRSRLSATFRRDPPTPQILHRVLTKIASSEALRSLLEQLSTNSQDLQTLCQRSYTHPNGYHKLVLLTTETVSVPFELRLHHWFVTRETNRTGDIHTHDWNFASLVLFGQFDSYIYRETPNNTHFHKFRYTRHSKSRYDVTHLGMIGLELLESNSRTAGESYCQDYRTIHSAMSHFSRGAITLILQGPTLKGFSHIYKKEQQMNTTKKVAALSKLEAQKSLSKAFTHLKQIS